MTLEILDKMGDKKITLETPIQFTLKMFASLIGGMIVLFFGFYGLVIAPKDSDHDAEILKIQEEHVEYTKSTNEHLMEINSSIGTLNGTVNGFGERFNDLRNLKTEETVSGGFNTDGN